MIPNTVNVLSHLGAFFSGLHTACVRIAIESIFEAPEGTGGN